MGTKYVSGPMQQQWRHYQTCTKFLCLIIVASPSVAEASSGELCRLLLAAVTIIANEIRSLRTFSCFLESPPRSRVFKASLRFLTISAGDRGRLNRGISSMQEFLQTEPRGDWDDRWKSDDSRAVRPIQAVKRNHLKKRFLHWWHYGKLKHAGEQRLSHPSSFLG